LILVTLLFHKEVDDSNAEKKHKALFGLL